MARHASFPDPQRRHWIRHHLIPSIEDHPSQPSSKHYAKDGGPCDEITDLLRRHIRIPSLREPVIEPIADEKCPYIREAVPAQPESVGKLDNEGTEVVKVI